MAEDTYNVQSLYVKLLVPVTTSHVDNIYYMLNMLPFYQFLLCSI
jgi:hypothetical protein